jgi:hypothetical protein
VERPALKYGASKKKVWEKTPKTVGKQKPHFLAKWDPHFSKNNGTDLQYHWLRDQSQDGQAPAQGHKNPVTSTFNLKQLRN